MYRTLFALCALAAASPSQNVLNARTIGQLEEYRYTAVQKSPGDPMATVLVDEHVVRVPGRGWLHMELADVRLGFGSKLEFTSLEDGGTQVMRRDNKRGETAFFNGDAVRIRLWAGPNTTGNTYTITRLGVASRSASTSPAGGGCGGLSDSRVPSLDKRVCRIMHKTKGKLQMLGTGFLVSRWNCIATAGHLFPSVATAQVQFNVPESNSNGTFRHAAPEDQYLWNPNEKVIRNGGNPGDDWAVFTVFPNDQTGKYPAEKQGDFFGLEYQSANWNKIATTGYGGDTERKRNNAQQTSNGKITSGSPSSCWHTCYTEPGSSGGPLYDRDTGRAVAIHYGCVGNRRGATMVTHPSFLAAYATLSQAPRVADLEVQSMTTDIGSSFTPGKTYRFRSRVKNIGRAASKQVRSSYVLSKDTVLSSGDTFVHTFTTRALSKDEQLWHSANVKIPTGVARGHWYPAVLFDRDHDMPELKKSNNWRIGTRVFSTGLADFRVDGMTSSSYTIWTGKKVNLTARFINVGGINAPWAQHAFYLSGNAGIDPSQDTLIASFWTRPLGLSGRETVVRNVTIPDSNLTGKCYLGVYADYRRVVDEKHEDNNGRSAIAWCDRAPCPDLQARELTANTTDIAPNATVELRSMVQNVGNLAAGASKAKLVLSKDSSMSQDDRVLATFDTPALAQFAFKRDTRDVKIPADVQPGPCYFLFVADADGDVQECNESNNVFALRVTCVGRADLVVTKLALPKSAAAGDVIAMTVQTRNIGTASSTPTSAGWFLSTNSAISTTDTYLGAHTVPKLAPTKAHDIVVQVRVPYSTAAGITYIGVLADARRGIDELDETNNGRATKIDISPYAGSGRYLEWRRVRMDNPHGAYLPSDARFVGLDGAAAKMALVAPQHSGKLYVCVLSKSQAAFQFDVWTDAGLMFLNGPLFPNWLGFVPGSGIAYPKFGLPKGAINLAATIGVHAVFLDGTNFDGFADNSLRLELKRKL